MSFSLTFRRSAFLLTAVPFFGLATGALFPLVALQLEGVGLSAGFIGMVTSVYYAGSLFGALTYGALVRKLGYRVGFAVAATIAAICAIGLATAEQGGAWLALRFGGGYALGAYYAVVDSWFQALGDRRTRGKLFALYETVRLAATALGPFLLVWGALQASLLVVAFAYLLSILPAWMNPPPLKASLKSFAWSGTLDIARCLPLPLLVAFCGGVANASFYGLSAVYAEALNFKREAIAIFVAVVLVAPALSELPLGAVADRSRRMAVAAKCGLAACIACMFLVAWQAPPFWLICFGGMIVGGMMVPMYAFGLSRLTDAVGEEEALAAATAGLLAYNAGAFAGPTAAGLAMGLLGPPGLYVLLGIIAGIATVAAMLDLLTQRCCPETS